MKWLIKLTLIFLLSSCSAQWHLQKAVKKDPMILEKDTLVVQDTIVIPPVAITDTVVTEEHDTITLVKERVKVQLVRKQDTIIIDAQCASDTIVRTIEVPVEKVTYVERETTKQFLYRWILYILVAVLGYRLLMKLLGLR